MARIEKRSTQPASAEALFQWHARERAFERLNPPFDPVVLESRTGKGLDVGTQVTVRVRLGPVEQRWVARHTALEPGRMFRDEQVSGPFARWVHTHHFADHELYDEIEFELPLKGLGALGNGVVRHKLERAFAYRHALLRADLDRHAHFAQEPRLTVGITGASGLIGTALAAYLDTAGHAVRLLRRGDFSGLDGCDAVVHLAGAPIGQRWSRALRDEIVTSRVDYTRALVEGMRRCARPPRVLLSGSAIGVYGERGDELLDESSAPAARTETGPGFLAGLCTDWETEALKADARVVLLRTGIVLSPRGGAIAKMLPAFELGAGGPIGSGRQWMSWISIEDQLGAIEHALFTDTLRGPVNFTAPEPVTARTFAKQLGHVLGRPSFARVPAFAIRAVFGESADAALLVSQRVKPAALEASGFKFLHPTLEQCLKFELGR
jgi:uncharacterized protein (TIGR01777 family)